MRGPLTGAAAFDLARERARSAPPPEMITLPAASERIGVSGATIRAAIMRGEIAGDWVGLGERNMQKVEVDEASLLAWARARRLIT